MWSSCERSSGTQLGQWYHRAAHNWIRHCLTSLKLEQLTTKNWSKIPTDINVLSCGPKASNISGISDAISPREIRKNPRSMYARVPRAMAQFVLKIEKLSHIMGKAPILEMARAYGLRPRLWLLILIDSEVEGKILFYWRPVKSVWCFEPLQPSTSCVKGCSSTGKAVRHGRKGKCWKKIRIRFWLLLFFVNFQILSIIYAQLSNSFAMSEIFLATGISTLFVKRH